VLQEAQVVNRGTIVRLVRDRGFGFVRTEDGQEVFFHATGMLNYPFDSLQEGQAVTFEIEQDTRGRGQRAVRIQIEG
jgi:CspA family cold shock protein